MDKQELIELIRITTMSNRLLRQGTKRSIELNKEWYSISNTVQTYVIYLEKYEYFNDSDIVSIVEDMIETLEITRRELDSIDFTIQDEETHNNYESAKRTFRAFRKSLTLIKEWIDQQQEEP